MPKRGGRGGRGGRGRGRGRGRGGFSGGRGRGGFNKKRRGCNGNGGVDTRGPPRVPNDDILMLDLDGSPSVYLPPATSMKAAAKRTRRQRMQDEAFNTEDNYDATMKLPLRQRFIDFVKASVYDPTKDVIKGLREQEQKRLTSTQKSDGSPTTETAIDVEIQEDVLEDSAFVGQGQATLEDESDTQDSVVDEESQDEDEEDKEDDDGEKTSGSAPPKPEPPKKAPKLNPLSQVPDDRLFFVDETPEVPINIRTVKEEEDHSVNAPIIAAAGPNTEFNPTLSIGHVHLSVAQDRNGQHHTHIPKGSSRGEQLKDFDPERHVASSSETPEMYQDYQRYITRVMGNIFANSDDDDDGDDDDDDDAELDDGRGIYDELDDDFEEEAKFIAGVSDDVEDDEDIPHADVTAETSNMEKLKLDDQDGPEFGFLEEDYETFDHSLVDVINIRYGSGSNQYHMKSFRLTGTYDHQWVDEELFSEFLIENGMPEHRLSAYFKYVKGLLEPPEEEEKNYDDVPFSDSEEEDFDHDHDDYYEGENDGLDDSDMEGLDDLIAYTKKYDGERDMEVAPTQTLKTRGKGKKKQLDLEGVSADLADRMHEQWRLRRDGKKARKERKEQTIANEHAKSKDLLLKYPYTLHVKDIRNEFEEFLNDSKRNALTFPPMDPHGIKTVQKFAYLYNMKARKFGAGLKSHAVAVKNKRTFRSLPDYHSIAMLMKQRPVFNRIDQKRAKADIDQEKSSRRGVPSKAHVKEGDIVGADAPEISSNNVGRKLLMKMGWKSGQGLGLDNAGIPEPVVAKIKKTKLGIR